MNLNLSIIATIKAVIFITTGFNITRNVSRNSTDKIMFKPYMGAFSVSFIELLQTLL